MTLRRAVELLGRGFIAHDGNGALRRALADGSLDAQTFLRELVCFALRLAFAEMIGSPPPPPWRSFVWSAEARPHLEAARISDDAVAEARAALRGQRDLGSQYESVLGLRAELDCATGAFRVRVERDGRRKSAGSYYTPPALVERLLDLVLDPLCDEAIERAGAKHAEQALLSIRVLDPACGTGSILRAVAARIARRIDELRGAPQDRGTLSRVIAATVLGTDIDPIAVEICKVSMWIDAGRPPFASTGLDERIRCEDALLGGAQDGTLRSAVDAVITNPPWLSYSGRQRPRVDAAYVERLTAREPALRAWPAAHTAFLLAAPRALSPGGRFGLVLPLAVAHLSRYGSARASIENSTGGDVRVIDCGEAQFRGVVQPTGLFTGRMRGSSRRHRGTTWHPEGAPSAPKSVELVEHLARFPKLDPAMFTDPGVHTGNVAKRIVCALQTGMSEAWAPMREGKDVEAFSARPPRKVVLTAPDLGPGEYCRVGELDRYDGVPILVRQTACRPIAARHIEPGHFRNSLLACSGIDGVPHEVTLAVLNSSLIGTWHHATTLDAAQRAFPQVKVSHLRNVPAFERARLDDVSPRGGELAARLVALVRAIEDLLRLGDATDPEVERRELELRWEIELGVAELYDVPRAWAETAWRTVPIGARMRVGRRRMPT